MTPKPTVKYCPESELAAWLALSTLPGVGFKTFKKVLKLFQPLQSFFSEQPAQLQAKGCSERLIQARTMVDWNYIERTIQWSEQPLHHILMFNSHAFPELLRHIDSCPPMLFVKGPLSILTAPQLAIVGSRRASIYGKKNATEFAKQISEQNIVVTSGLAEGIDTYAHYGAVSIKKPTIAVMGTGINVIYPRRNQALAEEILNNNGALVTEFFPGEPPQARNFPRRNRLISGLSLGVLVVEAGLHSGSLITAQYAAAQGRDVFAIPNGIYYAGCKGCHQLIQQGAKLVTSVQDIFDELNVKPFIYNSQSTMISGTRAAFCDTLPPQTEVLGKTQQKLLALAASGLSCIEEFVQHTGISPHHVAADLAELEMLGYLLHTSQGYELVTGR